MGAFIVTDTIFFTKVYDQHSIREDWVDSKLELANKKLIGNALFRGHEINVFQSEVRNFLVARILCKCVIKLFTKSLAN